MLERSPSEVPGAALHLASRLTGVVQEVWREHHVIEPGYDSAGLHKDEYMVDCSDVRRLALEELRRRGLEET